MENNIAVGRLWYRKGKAEYFSIKQLLETFPDIKFDFHIVLSEYDYKDDWTSKIEELDISIKYYSKEFMDGYFRLAYPAVSNLIDSFPKFIHFYHILIGHYLRRVLLYDYMLTFEYDVIFNGDLSYVGGLLETKTPFGVVEPQNSSCDKALLQSLSNLYQDNLLELMNRNNPNYLGINAGFQGINLKLFDEFLSQSNLSSLLSIFDFGGIYKQDGTEKWGMERTVFDTQEQSFYSIMNQIHSENFVVLPVNEYFFFPCWEDHEGYIDKAMESKIVHFTGHKKAQKLFDIINERI
jgi:hypothetical protein